MADMAPGETVQWAEFRQLAAVPTTAKIGSVAQSPDGRKLSILIEGLVARCEGTGQKTAVAILAGSIEAKIPTGLEWAATRADFRGGFALAHDSRATLGFALSRATDAQTIAASSEKNGDSVEFVRTLFSPAEVGSPATEGAPPSYAPITVSVELTLSCAGNADWAFTTVESVDIALWVR